MSPRSMISCVKVLVVLSISLDLLEKTVSYPRHYRSGDLRLIGGSSRYEGTVLIYHHRRWGSICDRRWDIRDANVVCRQLGYGPALQSIRASGFGIGRRRRWVNHMTCRGNERRLRYCRFTWGIRNDYRYCSGYARSAGVVCHPPTTTITTTTTTTTMKPTTERPTTTATTTTPKPTTQPTTTLATLPTTMKPTMIFTTRKSTSTQPTITTTILKSTTIKLKTTTTSPKTTTMKPTTTSTTPRPTTIKPTTTTTTPKPTTIKPTTTTTTPKPTTMKPTTTTTTAKPTTMKPTTTSTTPKLTTTKSPVTTPTTMISNIVRVEIPQIDVDKTINAILDQTNYNIIPSIQQNRSSLQEDQGRTDIHRTYNNNHHQHRKTTTAATTTPSTTTTTTTPTTTATTTPVPKTTLSPTTTTATTRTTSTKATTTTRSVQRGTSSNSVVDIELPVGKWFRDRVLNMWVLERRNGKILVAIPGERPKVVSRAKYLDLRREKLGLSEDSDDHDSMKADDPVASSNRPAAEPVRSSQISNVISSGSGSLSISGDSRSSQTVDNVIQTNSNTASDNKIIASSNTLDEQKKVAVNTVDTKLSTNTKLQIRRAGGRHRTRGRIEVLPPGKSTWGVICGDSWSMKEAIVACKHLRLGYAQQFVQTGYYGGHDQIKYYSSVKCTGRESRLHQCRWEEHNEAINCKNAMSVAGVVCTRSLPDLVPSIRMLETTAFLQDRHLYYLQCAMEEKCLGASAYAIQGSRGWQASTRRLLRFSSVVSNKGTADFKPAADRSAWEWHACHMHYHSMEIFAHYDVLDTNGNRVAEGLKASFCLEDSECNPGVYPKFNCQNFGQQGISVGCSDNYMADIDCQWIDITDVKAGNYKLKIEINPNMLVAEISFDNNVVECDLTYTGYYARIHNCKIQSLL